MTTDNNANPVVKESLTTQKEEMQRGMKILDVGTVIKPGDTFKYVTVEYMALVQNSCDIQLQMCAATRIALDKLADLYIALQSENDQLKKELSEVVGDGSPEWTCSACGNKNSFTTVKNGSPMDAQDEDLQCDECGSVNVFESPMEALREAIAVNESYIDEVVGLKDKLTTANKVIEETEKYMRGALYEIRTPIREYDERISACTKLLHEALSTIQSLKLKGK